MTGIGLLFFTGLGVFAIALKILGLKWTDKI